MRSRYSSVAILILTSFFLAATALATAPAPFHGRGAENLRLRGGEGGRGGGPKDRMMRAVSAFVNALKWEEPAPETYTPSAVSLMPTLIPFLRLDFTPQP